MCMYAFNPKQNTNFIPQSEESEVEVSNQRNHLRTLSVRTQERKELEVPSGCKIVTEPPSFPWSTVNVPQGHRVLYVFANFGRRHTLLKFIGRQKTKTNFQQIFLNVTWWMIGGFFRLIVANTQSNTGNEKIFDD
jgi:hypothetical protein